jgi:hypothetical protein
MFKVQNLLKGGRVFGPMRLHSKNPSAGIRQRLRASSCLKLGFCSKVSQRTLII